jgi:hypothetical protein
MWRLLLLATGAALVVAGVSTSVVLTSQSGSVGHSIAGSSGNQKGSPVYPTVTRGTSAQVTQGTSQQPITARLLLEQTNAGAGKPIRGEMTLTNTTTQPISVPCGSWIYVGLTNSTIKYDPAQPANLCAPESALPPGPSTFQVSILTTYTSCSYSLSTNANVPHCKSGQGVDRIPPLPPGTYYTKIVFGWADSKQIATPPSIEVTLRN